MSTRSTERGRQHVEVKLIEAASQLLAERGPALVSVRDIAERAGVNKGQIHHYFGGKDGLIEAAIRKLATDHFRTKARQGDTSFPEPLTLGTDPVYWRAIVRILLDGNHQLATLELREGISVPRQVLRAHGGPGEVTLARRAKLAEGMAIEMGWAVLRDFIQPALELTDDEIPEVEARLRSRLRALLASD